MKKLILLLLICTIETAGFSQSLPFPNQGVVLQRSNLDVRWRASKHPWPTDLWTYQMVLTKFSPTVISNLMVIGSFTEKDKRDYGTNALLFGKPYSTPNLRISFIEGEVQYDGDRPHYSETNLAMDVPGTNQLFQLTTNFLPKLGINFSEIPKTKKGQLEITCSEPAFTEYYANQTFITNIEFRTASFGRLIDGVECDPHVGSCRINFGEHGRITSIWLYWRNVERDKLYSAATPDQIIQWIREGKAVLPKEIYIGMGSTAPINWSTVKKVTIKKATAVYWGEFFLGEREHRPIFPSPVVPYAMLEATIDIGTTNLDVKIPCPVIDVTKP